VSGCIPKLFLVRVIMKVAENTVEGVKFTYFIAAAFVHAVEMFQRQLFVPFGFPYGLS
jgi:hypothetical protein